MLQVGGIQEAVIVAPPAPVELTTPVVLTVTEAGFDETQVSGTVVGGFAVGSAIGLLTGFVSVTVASIVAVAPLFPVMLVPPMPCTARVIDWTGQVMNVVGRLFVFAMEANTCASPGAFGVA